MKKVFNIICTIAAVVGVVLMFKQPAQDYCVIIFIASWLLTLCAVTNINESADYSAKPKVLRSAALYTLALGALWGFTPYMAWYVPLLTYVLFASIGFYHVSVMSYCGVFGNDMPIPTEKDQKKHKYGLWCAITMVVVFIATII